MSINKKLDLLHNLVIEKWMNKKKKGTVESATGTGKSFIMCKAILSMPIDSTVLFLFETTSRRNTLNNEISKYEKLYGVKIHNKYNISMATYQSAYKWTHKHFNLVIGDEFHEGLTEKYSDFFFNNSYDCILGLSATIDRTISYGTYTKGDLLDSIAPVIYRYSLEESIKAGTSRKLNIYLIPHELDNINLNITAGSVKKPFMQTEKKFYEYWQNRLRKLMFVGDLDNKEFLMRRSLERRNSILNNCPSKVEPVKKLLDIIEGKTIIYANSIDYLENVTSNVVSSRNTDDENQRIIDAFQDNKINNIASFKKLEQGINLNNLDNVIIASFYSKEKSFLQRFGRCRLKPNGEHANIFILVSKDTIEEKWIEKALEDKMFNIIKCDDINDCLNKYVMKNV